ncbi:MAG: peptide deformylase [Proteobacteria bacterium]|nr:peptide deformylase [Pseudomonadota bacterium]
MTLARVLRYPHQDLRKMAQPVIQFDDSLKDTLANLFEVLYAHHGWGLAATQVGIMSQIVVMDISPDQNQPMYFINPKIVAEEGEVESEEDNLSFPGVYIKIKRAKKIELQFQDESGNPQTQIFEGLLSCCIQQKVDSLNGKLFIDHLSALKRTRLLAKYNKMKHHTHSQACGHGCDDHHH